MFRLFLTLILTLATAACSAPAATSPQLVDVAPVPAKPINNAPANIDLSCRTDADCTVKNVGNCCGYYPACVNVASTPNPAAVQASCRAKGMVSVCGFPEISGCSCVKGRCASNTSGNPLRQPMSTVPNPAR